MVEYESCSQVLYSTNENCKIYFLEVLQLCLCVLDS